MTIFYHCISTTIQRFLLISWLILVMHNSAIADKDGVKIQLMDQKIVSVHLHDKLYLNGCSADPSEYSLTPKIVSNIVYELPNVVTELAMSPYGRPVKTEAISIIELNGRRLKASLNNFRDFSIVNDNGQMLAQRRITGATSLYEIRHENKVIAWGVGWKHYGCDKENDYYNTDFSAYRVFVPVIKNGEIEVHQRLFHGLAQTRYFKALRSVQQTILVDTTDIGSGAAGCYYCLPIFIGINNHQGLFEINNLKKLQEAKIDLKEIDPVEIISWLAYYKEKAEFQNFVTQNLSMIFDGFKDWHADFFFLKNGATINDLSAQKPICQTFLSSQQKIREIKEIVKHCFPQTLSENDEYSALFHLYGND